VRIIRTAGMGFSGGTRQLVVQEDAPHDHTARVSITDGKILASMLMQKTALVRFAQDILETFGKEDR